MKASAASKWRCSQRAVQGLTASSRINRLRPERSDVDTLKAYEALPVGGALIVYEAIIDDERRQNTFGLLMCLMAFSAQATDS